MTAAATAQPPANPFAILTTEAKPVETTAAPVVQPPETAPVEVATTSSTLPVATTAEPEGAIDRVIAKKRGRPAGSKNATSSTGPVIGRPYLYFDLETVPDCCRLDQFGLDPLPEEVEETPVDELPPVAEFLKLDIASAKQRLAGIAPHEEWIKSCELTENMQPKPRKGMLDLMVDSRKVRDQAKDAAAARLKLLSVTPEFCSICALGYALGDEPARSLVVGQKKQPDGDELITELDILEQFWQLVSTCGPLVGFNCLGFDLPVIFIRSFLLDAGPCRKIDTTPWKDDVIDLMQKRYPKGGQRGLKDLAKIMGFTIPAGDCDGSKVHELVQAGQLDQVAEYVRSDIDVTRSLHKAYRGFWC